MTSHRGALARKDLRLHGRAVAISQICAVLLLWMLTRTGPDDHGRNLPLVVNFNLIGCALWAEWLIAREKAKETFAWLRTLPVSDTDIVVAKFALAWAISVSAWLLTSGILLRSLFVPDRTGLWVVLTAGIGAFSALTIASRWRLGPKTGQMAPFGLLFLLLTPLILMPDPAARALEDAILSWVEAPGAWIAVSASLVAGHLLIVVLTAGWVNRSATAALIE